MTTSYEQLINYIKQYADANEMVKRFESDFESEMPNFATKSEAYPILYMSPTISYLGLNTDSITINVFCWDVIQKDRANINHILSDTLFILNGLKKWIEEGPDTRFGLLGNPSPEPFNNGLLDYCGGWKMTIEIEMDTISLCELPLDL